MSRFSVDPNIEHSSTLPKVFYTDPDIFEELKEKVFSKTWHWITTESQIPELGSVYPFNLYDRFLDEPLFFARNKKGEVKIFEIPYRSFNAGKTDFKNHMEFLFFVKVIE